MAAGFGEHLALSTYIKETAVELREPNMIRCFKLWMLLFKSACLWSWFLIGEGFALPTGRFNTLQTICVNHIFVFDHYSRTSSHLCA